MTHAPTLLLRASTAVVAVLALGTTPAWAQDAAPVDPPAVSIPAPQSQIPQPTITLPGEAPASAAPTASASPAMVSQPMVQQTPVVVPPAEPAVDAASAEERAPARRTIERRPAARSAPAAPPATVAPAAAAPAVAEPLSAAPMAPAPVSPAASVPIAPPPVAATPPEGGDAQAVLDDDGMGTAATIAALLLALGLGAGAYFALRGRRRSDDGADEYAVTPEQVYVEPDPVMTPAAPLPAFATVEDVEGRTVVREPAPEAARMMGEEELVPATHPAEAPAVQAAAVADSTGRAFEMPAGPVPQTRAERDALLERMVAAPPDAANPFTSRKARLRRARIMLQSREITQKQEATKPFDWRTYKPATSDPAPATPPRVTA